MCSREGKQRVSDRFHTCFRPLPTPQKHFAPGPEKEHELVTILWKKHKGRKKEIIQKPDCLSKSIVKGKEKEPNASKECFNEFT